MQLEVFVSIFCRNDKIFHKKMSIRFLFNLRIFCVTSQWHWYQLKWPGQKHFYVHAQKTPDLLQVASQLWFDHNPHLYNNEQGVQECQDWIWHENNRPHGRLDSICKSSMHDYSFPTLEFRIRVTVTYLFLRKNPPCMPLLNPVRLLILAINFQLFCKMDQRLLWHSVWKSKFLPCTIISSCTLVKISKYVRVVIGQPKDRKSI